MGQSVNFGIHSRLLGQMLLVLAVVLGLGGFHVSKKAIFTASVIFIYIMVLLFHSQGEGQIESLLSLSTDKNNYYSSKLSLFFQMSFVPLIAGFLLSGKARDNYFLQGMVYAALMMSVIAILVGIKYSSYWFSADYQVVTEWREEAVFSSISMSILHLAGFISAVECARTKNNKYIFSSLAMINVIFIVVYQQRTAWVFMVLSLIYIFLNRQNGLRIGKRIVFLFTAIVFIALAVVAMGHVGLLNDRIMSYALQMVSPELFSSRSGYFEFAWQGFLDRPLGNGWASYSLNGPFRYPHNVVLESLYELGIVGGITIIILLIMMLLSTKGLLDCRFSGNPALGNGVVMGLLFGYLILFSLKAGDINSLNMQLSLSLLFSSYRRAI